MPTQRAQVGYVANERSSTRDDCLLAFQRPIEPAEIAFDDSTTGRQSCKQLSTNLTRTDLGENVAMLLEHIADRRRNQSVCAQRIHNAPPELQIVRMNRLTPSSVNSPS